MTPAPATTAWVIKAPDEHLILDTISEHSELNAWSFFVGGMKKDHERKKRLGYRCVRVQVQEIPHD